MWKHPDTDKRYYVRRALFLTREARDADGRWNSEAARWNEPSGIAEIIKDEWANRLLWHTPIGDPIVILGGDTYRPLPYSVVRCEPDDTDGRVWDSYLMSLLPLSREDRERKNNESAAGRGL